MKHVDFYFCLDVTFKKGTNVSEVKKLREQGKNVNDHYNPNPTAVYLCCSVEGVYLKVCTGIKVKPVDWDFAANLISKKSKNYYEQNMILDLIKNGVVKEYYDMRIAKATITPETIKSTMYNVINGKEKESPGKAFWEAFDEFLDEKKKSAKEATIVKYNSLRKALLSFESDTRPLSFDAITTSLYLDFLSFSRETLKHLNNTSGKNIRNLRAFLGWAVNKQYHSNMDFKTFKVQNDHTETIFLTHEELKQIENYQVGLTDSQRISKDIFLFQCYTGQRIGDVQLLKKRDIISENGRDLHWNLYQSKGSKKLPLHVMILSKAEEILTNYIKMKQKDDLIFPSQSTVIINKNLKKIARSAGINAPVTKTNFRGDDKVLKDGRKYEFVSTHMARRTFVTLARQHGLTTEQVASMTGHSSVKEMNPYLGVDKKEVRERIQRMFS